MKNSTPDNEKLYGDAVSDYYDQLYPAADIPDMLRFMHEIQSPIARVLDLGVGTGRTALPMAMAGYEVVGVDISESMLDELRMKDVDELVVTVRADMTEVSGEQSFDLVVCLNNTMSMVLDAERRQSTFENAAANLRPGGALVIETASPFPYLRGESTRHRFTPLGRGDRVLLDIISVDAYALEVTFVRTLVSPGGMMTFSEQNHLLTPTEMDLIARSAGLVLVARQETWRGVAASDSSSTFISVYRPSE